MHLLPPPPATSTYYSSDVPTSQNKRIRGRGLGISAWIRLSQLFDLCEYWKCVMGVSAIHRKSWWNHLPVDQPRACSIPSVSRQQHVHILVLLILWKLSRYDPQAYRRVGRKEGGVGRDGMGRPYKKGGSTSSDFLWITGPDKPAQVEAEQLHHSVWRLQEQVQKVGAPQWFCVN